MAGRNQLETLLTLLRQTVERATARFATEPGENRVQAGQWGPAEVLSHLVFWHRANLEGIESVMCGGEPYQISADTTLDEPERSGFGGDGWLTHW